MARLIEPTRIFSDKRFIADRLPVANARGVAGQIEVRARLSIVGGPVAREADGRVGVAFARAKTISHRNNKDVSHLGFDAQHFAAANLDLQADATGISDIERQRLAARLRNCLATQRRRIAFGCRQPCARQIGRFIAKSGHLGNDRVLLRVHVIRIEIARMPVGRWIPARFFIHRRCPATIVVTALQGALG